MLSKHLWICWWIFWWKVCGNTDEEYGTYGHIRAWSLQVDLGCLHQTFQFTKSPLSCWLMQMTCHKTQRSSLLCQSAMLNPLRERKRNHVLNPILGIRKNLKTTFAIRILYYSVYAFLYSRFFSFALLCSYVHVWSIPMLFICPSAFGQSERNVRMCQHESDGLRCGSRHLIGLGPSAPPKGHVPLCLRTHLPCHLAARRQLWPLQAQVKTSLASVSNLSVSLHRLTLPPL